jgi:hypothetical protein
MRPQVGAPERRRVHRLRQASARERVEAPRAARAAGPTRRTRAAGRPSAARARRPCARRSTGRTARRSWHPPGPPRRAPCRTTCQTCQGAKDVARDGCCESRMRGCVPPPPARGAAQPEGHPGGRLAPLRAALSTHARRRRGAPVHASAGADLSVYFADSLSGGADARVLPAGGVTRSRTTPPFTPSSVFGLGNSVRTCRRWVVGVLGGAAATAAAAAAAGAPGPAGAQQRGARLHERALLQGLAPVRVWAAVHLGDPPAGAAALAVGAEAGGVHAQLQVEHQGGHEGVKLVRQAAAELACARG